MPYTVHHKKKISYLWTYALYGPVRNAFDAGKSITRASGGGGGWKSRLYWAMWNDDIEPSGECHLGPQKVEIT